MSTECITNYNIKTIFKSIHSEIVNLTIFYFLLLDISNFNVIKRHLKIINLENVRIFYN
jgi:hypothetical protein